MELMLKGKIVTPIITKKTVFKVEGCRAMILHPKRRYITKSHKERRLYPFSFTGYLGSLQLTYRCQTHQEAKGKLEDLILLRHIGRFWREGLGRIEWISGKIGSRFHSHKPNLIRRVKIRQGLPHHFPEPAKQ